ncbi:hypothetical protein AACH10_08640 [Ideonella sp. DXS22W]|uniref:Lipoprotein n=1 Tax=Pseudaquabacterium inlustre TaxID=2984192 RepID=A0ABU9CEK7_9BURK
MNAGFNRAVVLLACSAMLTVTTACTTVTRHSPPAAGLQQLPLAPSDTVTVLLKSGEQRAITVTQLAPDRLLGVDEGSRQPVELAAADIASVDLKRVDGVRTGLLVLAVVLVAALAATASAAKSLADGIGKAGSAAAGGL